MRKAEILPGDCASAYTDLAQHLRMIRWVGRAIAFAWRLNSRDGGRNGEMVYRRPLGHRGQIRSEFVWGSRVLVKSILYQDVQPTDSQNRIVAVPRAAENGRGKSPPGAGGSLGKMCYPNAGTHRTHKVILNRRRCHGLRMTLTSANGENVLTCMSNSPSGTPPYSTQACA